MAVATCVPPCFVCMVWIKMKHYVIFKIFSIFIRKIISWYFAGDQEQIQFPLASLRIVAALKRRGKYFEFRWVCWKIPQKQQWVFTRYLCLESWLLLAGIYLVTSCDCWQVLFSPSQFWVCEWSWQNVVLETTMAEGTKPWHEVVFSTLTGVCTSVFGSW